MLGVGNCRCGYKKGNDGANDCCADGEVESHPESQHRNDQKAAALICIPKAVTGNIAQR